MGNVTVTDVRFCKGDSAFLIDDGKNAVLFDTGFAFSGEHIASNVKKALGDRKLDAILLSHSHYDHALATPYILKHYPDAKVVAGEYAKTIFEKPTARALMKDLDRKFAFSLGINDYEDLTDSLRVDVPLRDSDTVSFGNMVFRAIHLPGHTKCSFGFYLEGEKLFLSSETLGVFDGEESIIPSFLVGYRMTLDSIDKALSLDIDNILIPHLGILDRERTEFYLANAKKSAVSSCREIASILKFKGTREDAFEFFKNKFYKGAIVEGYPIAAFTLNTNIMIDLIIKEFGL